MLQAASSSWRQELQPYDASSGEEQTMPSRNTRGRFTSIQGSPATPTETRGRNHRQSVVIPDDYPSLLRGAQGNIIWKEGETAENAVGVANIATAAINILRHLINAEGALVEEDFQRVKEFVNFVNEDDLKRHVQELTPLQQATPQRRLTSTFLSEESAEAPVQRRLFGLTPTPAKRKKPRLLEELEQESDAHAEDRQSSLFRELQAEAESESETEDAGRVQGRAREQSEMPYILEDCWEVAGELIQVSVLYANGQALPLQDTDVAKLLGKFHEAVIKEGRINVTLAKSMGMLGIPAAAVLRLDPAVAFLTGEGVGCFFKV
ncbi:hypothetical protein GGI42DRAFT_355671 [Trichoderma sp. SZMC 28013]